MAIDQDRVSRVLSFTLTNGERVFPVRMKRRDTGAMAFRISKRGNTLNDSQEVDEETMLRMVVERGFAVRCSSLDGKIAGLYKPDGRAVRNVHRA